MRVSFRISFLFFTCVLAWAQTNPPTLPEILQRHEAALGGREKIQALRSIVIRGVYNEGGPIEPGKALIPDAYQAFMRPYFEAIGDPADPNPDIREGFDGSAWEYYGDPGVTVRTVGAAASATRHASEFLQDSLLDTEQKGYRLTLEGESKIGDRKAFQIHCVWSDDTERLIFVDAETYLIIAERKSAPKHAFGEAVPTESRFYDYAPVNGVMMWHSVRETEIVSGKIFNEFKRVSIEANTITSPEQFSPPVRQKTPLQSWLEHLYAERSDPLSVMYSYRVFRRANPELDTRAGVEFIGYQMVKMGDYRGAIELLKANASDYPKSASAQFGLGRAYGAAGQVEEAKAAMRKALEIDPKFTKASKGLDALK